MNWRRRKDGNIGSSKNSGNRHGYRGKGETGKTTQMVFECPVRSYNMHAAIELPKAFSVRDDHEFLPFQHLLARMSPKLIVKQVATGVHVNGGGTVYWGLVFLNDKPPSKKKVEIALREAGFDFAHNVLTQAADVRTDHSSGEEGGK
jgi:hypothetical protein